MTALHDALVESSADLVTRTLEHQVVSLQMALLVPRGTQLLLRFVPAIIADSRTQGQHGVDVAGGPMHAGPFEASLHHHFVATFHDAGAYRPAVLLILVVLHAPWRLARYAYALFICSFRGKSAHSLASSASTGAGPSCFKVCN